MTIIINLRRWHLALFALLVLLSAGGIVFADKELARNGFWRRGEIYLGSATEMNYHLVDRDEDNPFAVAQMEIQIPQGKRGRLMAEYTGEMWIDPGYDGPSYQGSCIGFFGVESAFGDSFSPGPSTLLSTRSETDLWTNNRTVIARGVSNRLESGWYTLSFFVYTAPDTFDTCIVEKGFLTVIADVF